MFYRNGSRREGGERLIAGGLADAARRIGCVFVCWVGFLNFAHAQTFAAPFDDGSYVAKPIDTDILSIHGLTFAPADPNTIVLSSLISTGSVFYSAPVTRDANGHIDGVGNATLVAAAPGAEVGSGLLFYGPDHVLLFTYANSGSIVGEVPHGATSVTDVPVQTSGNSPTALAVKPAGFQGAGKLVFDSINSSRFYEADLERAGNVYDIANVTPTTDFLAGRTLSGSLAYVDPSAPHIGSPAMMVAEGNGLYLYGADAAGSPIDSTRRLFFGAGGEWMAVARDPVTSDILATTNRDPSLFIFRGFPATTITIIPTTLPAGRAGVAYSSVQLSANGGTAPYVFEIRTGELPTGLGLSSNGAISGVPSAAGVFNFVAQAADVNGVVGAQAYSLVIDERPTITMTPAVLPDGTVGKSYDQNVVGNGGTLPYLYSITGGALPHGLVLDGQSGAISGTPTTIGNFSFTITATDSSTGPGAPFSGMQSYSITIGSPSPVALDGTVQVPATGSLSFSLAQFISGSATSVSIVSLPAHGTLGVDGLVVTYTSDSSASEDRFTYIASNSSGTSSVATITLLVSEPVKAILTLTNAGRILLAIGFLVLASWRVLAVHKHNHI
jgi:hypothetical protein